ncbi:alpha/beta hydrolase [Streptomyces sp. H39-C1]|uniref:alpha/beta hydrolase n=1 Tax=Streptomyces sp. H39-C1 TaxID=3004355 RepID=UPI002F35A650
MEDLRGVRRGGGGHGGHGGRGAAHGGGDHGQYLNGNACVDGIVTGYLLTGAAPAHDTSCAANPLPVPDPARTGPYALS